MSDTRDREIGSPNAPCPESSEPHSRSQRQLRRRRRHRRPRDLLPAFPADVESSTRVARGAGADPSAGADYPPGVTRDDESREQPTTQSGDSRRFQCLLPLDFFAPEDPGHAAARSLASPRPPSDPPGVIAPVTRTRVRQSVLYSNRPRRARRGQGAAQTREYPSEASQSELGRAITDLPILDTLSLTDPDPPLSIAQTTEESDDDESFLYDNNHALHEPIEFGIDSFGPETLCYSGPRPRFKWDEGVQKRGHTLTPEELTAAVRRRSSAQLSRLTSQALSGGSDSSFPTNKATKENPKDSDDDAEEVLRLIRESRVGRTYFSLRKGFDSVMATLQAHELAAEKGIESPPLLPTKHLHVHQETQSLQARQQSSAATQPPQHSTTQRKPRCEASNAELAENAEKWMCEELKMVFANYVERRDDLKELDWYFSELCHQCFNVEHYHKIFHHYNFTVKMKKPNSDDWDVALYFAEVKQIFRRKYYFCCRLEPYENGHCYACKSQGVDELQHPATGGFETGSSNTRFGLYYE